MVKKKITSRGGEGHMNRDELRALETKLLAASQKMTRIRSGSHNEENGGKKIAPRQLSSRKVETSLTPKSPTSSKLLAASHNMTRIRSGALTYGETGNREGYESTSSEDESTVSSAASQVEAVKREPRIRCDPFQTDDGYSTASQSPKLETITRSQAGSLDESNEHDVDEQSVAESVLSRTTSDLLTALSSMSDFFLASNKAEKQTKIETTAQSLSAFQESSSGSCDSPVKMTGRHKGKKKWLLASADSESVEPITMSLSMIDAALSLESTPSGLQAAVEQMLKSSE